MNYRAVPFECRTSRTVKNNGARLVGRSGSDGQSNKNRQNPRNPSGSINLPQTVNQYRSFAGKHLSTHVHGSRTREVLSKLDNNQDIS